MICSRLNAASAAPATTSEIPITAASRRVCTEPPEQRTILCWRVPLVKFAVGKGAPATLIAKISVPTDHPNKIRDRSDLARPPVRAPAFASQPSVIWGDLSRLGGSLDRRAFWVYSGKAMGSSVVSA